jgi:hypothetical protein
MLRHVTVRLLLLPAHPIANSSLLRKAYTSSDYPSSLPVTLRQAALTIEDTNRYALTSPYDWASLFPGGNGWVRLGPDGRRFAVSMYHQLHCLNAVRHALVQARRVAGLHLNDSDSSMSARSPARPLLPPETPMQAFSHADHCFNYLRQTILCVPLPLELTCVFGDPFKLTLDRCAADTTIEASHFLLRPDGVNDTGASGIGMTHTCRDWTQLREFLQDNSEEWVRRDAAGTHT